MSNYSRDPRYGGGPATSTPPPPRQQRVPAPAAGRRSNRRQATEERWHGETPMRPPDRPVQSGGQLQSYAQPSVTDSAQYPYDGSTYRDSTDEDYDSWPLPPRPYVPPPRPGNSSQIPRRTPPPRPQRPDYQQSILDPPRHMDYRTRPVPQSRAVRSPPPPPSAISHHGSGQWTDDGYATHPLIASLPPVFPNITRPHPPTSMYAYTQPPTLPKQQKGRPSQGPPPSARRGPTSYHPWVGPVQPIAEESESLRTSGPTGSMRNTVGSGKSLPSPVTKSPEITHEEPEREKSRPSSPEPVATSEDEYGLSTDTGFETARQGSERPERRTQEESSPEPGNARRMKSTPKRSSTLTSDQSGDRLRTESSSNSLSSLPIQKPSPRQSTDFVPRVPDPAPPIPDIPRDPDSIPTIPDIPRVPNSVSPVPEIPRGNHVSQQRSVSREGAVSPERRSQRGAGKQKFSLPISTITTTISSDAEVQSPENESPVRVQSGGPFSSGTGLIESSSDSDNELGQKKPLKHKRISALSENRYSDASQSQSVSSAGMTVDARIHQILGSLEKGGVLTAEDVEDLRNLSEKFPTLAGRPRPPPLDVGAVRDAEARGSLTSLSDLIQRATTLVSNLDRGKTASRLGLDWARDPESGGERHLSPSPADYNRRSAASMSDIISSFPPATTTGGGNSGGYAAPAIGSSSKNTSRNENMHRPSNSNWSAHLQPSPVFPSEATASANAAKEKKKKKDSRRRRYCGMPLWLFIFLIVLVILLISAAVVVPVVLIVVPEQNRHASGGRA